MRTIKAYGDRLPENYLNEIVEALRDGKIIVYPTDTLYAFGCDALNNRAIEKICRLKGINPVKQRLSIVCADISQAAGFVKINNVAFDIMKANLPGPFTFILPASSTLPKVFKGRKEVGVRIPACNIAQSIAAALGNPLLSTSIGLNDDTVEDGLCSISADMLEAATMETIAPLHNEIAIAIAAGDDTGSPTPSAIISLLDPADPEILREGSLPLSF